MPTPPFNKMLKSHSGKDPYLEVSFCGEIDTRARRGTIFTEEGYLPMGSCHEPFQLFPLGVGYLQYTMAYGR